jgi:hypothetical protein
LTPMDLEISFRFHPDDMIGNFVVAGRLFLYSSEHSPRQHRTIRGTK